MATSPKEMVSDAIERAFDGMRPCSFALKAGSIGNSAAPRVGRSRQPIPHRTYPAGGGHAETFIDAQTTRNAAVVPCQTELHPDLGAQRPTVGTAVRPFPLRDSKARGEPPAFRSTPRIGWGFQVMGRNQGPVDRSRR